MYWDLFLGDTSCGAILVNIYLPQAITKSLRFGWLLTGCSTVSPGSFFFFLSLNFSGVKLCKKDSLHAQQCRRFPGTCEQSNRRCKSPSLVENEVFEAETGGWWVPCAFPLSSIFDGCPGGDGGGYLRNFWVGICRWDPGTLSLCQN